MLIELLAKVSYNIGMKIRRKILNTFAVFEKASEGGYDVSFPTFPGCATFGKTFEEAKKYAREALSLWLEEMKSSHLKIPKSFSRPIIDEVSVSI